MVLPLPLNAVEHYMLADDSADYPRCFVFVLRLNQSLDRNRLATAIDGAINRQPLLSALVNYEGGRPQQWIKSDDPRYSIEWSAEEASPVDGRGPILPFDLRHEPGVRFRVHRDEAGDALRIEFHHACTDGLGAVQFIGDLLALYAADSNIAEARLPTLDPNRLAVRDGFGLTGWRRPLRWLYGSAGWLAAIEFLMHRPVPLGTLPPAASSVVGRRSGFLSRSLTRSQTSALLHTAKRERVTVNDLLLRDMFTTLQQIFEQHWPLHSRAHKRIMVPTNLRSSGDSLLPAANVVAMINLDRRPQRWADPRRLLKVLHWELTLVKRLRLGIIFVQILHTLQSLFGSLRRFLPADRCQATCVVSNLGPVLTDVEPGRCRSVEFYPPIRPLTSAAFGVLTHDGQMSVSLHYDASALTADQARELLTCFVDKLRSYEALGEGAPFAPTARVEESEPTVSVGFTRSES